MKSPSREDLQALTNIHRSFCDRFFDEATALQDKSYEIGLRRGQKRLNARLLQALDIFTRCAMPVAPEINPRGYTWSEVHLDQALKTAREAIAAAAGRQHD